MRFKASLALGLLLVALESKPAFATFHDIKVKAVFAGSAAHPNAQYIVIQAWRDLQDEVQTHSVLTFDATGASTGTFTFSSSVPNDADQMTILVATADAAALFGLTADLAMTPVLSPLGGKACWDGSTPDDCVSWGTYSGSATGVGTPYNQGIGIVPGYAIQRRLDICMAADHLDACDDTDDSENDFISALPHPITNPGVEGTTPAATCGNGTLEGLEGCDDNNTNDGDGCSAICHIEPAPLAPSSLSVDYVADPTGTSNVNGVFEPGESVRISPYWNNEGAGNPDVRAQIANFTGPTTGGPPFPTYRISDSAAYYAVVLPGETKPCSADSDCYLLFADALNRPARHWDATFDEILTGSFGLKRWTLHIGASFTDVSTELNVDPYYPFIETIFHNGVTSGCGDGTTFCPLQNTLRQEMAVFLLKGKLGAGYAPPACTPGTFGDVDCSSPYAAYIEDLKTRGITSGCGNGSTFCPEANVLRQEMAVFLLKTLLGGGYNPPACTPGTFGDVDCSSPYAAFVEDLKTRGITSGCHGGTDFCPTDPITRQEMAVFLSLTFGLALYGP